MKLVLFEDVNGLEVFVNPERVIWVREYGDRNTVISCGGEDTTHHHRGSTHGKSLDDVTWRGNSAVSDTWDSEEGGEFSDGVDCCSLRTPTRHDLLCNTSRSRSHTYP